jgi:hypothetical protein
MNSDLLTAHSRIEIARALQSLGSWRGIRHGVPLKMHLEENLLGKMIVCEFRIGRKKKQVTGETVFEIGNTLRSELRGIM